MNLTNEPSGDSPAPVIKAAPVAPRINKNSSPLSEFYDFIQVGHTEAIQGFVFNGRNDQPNDHLWNTRKMDFGPWSAEKVKNRKPAYLIMSAFTAGQTSRYGGRSKDHVVAIRGFWIDVEGSAEKFAKEGGEDGGYPDGKAAFAAVLKFVEATGLFPSFIVLTGSGGVHLHFVLDKAIGLAEWLGRAKALVALAQKHGFKIDAQCTTDAARIMRAPGSLYQKTGREVTAHRWRPETYTLDEWDRLVGYEPGTLPAVVGPGEAGALEVNINGDILDVAHTPYSYKQAAERCGAMHKAAERNGRDTPEPVWILALQGAALSIEGRELAHEISSGYPGYDEAETDKKIDSRKGGPANCEAWGNAWGPGGPCESCEWRGKIKNPAVQLGAVVVTTPPGSVALAEPEALVPWVAELNSRFALGRQGAKMMLIDFQTPRVTMLGMDYGIGALEISGFRSMLNGRFAPVQKAGEKQRGLADAWLAHPQRRQYEGQVYDPGKTLPASILNLWQGFAVEPVPGDVSLWLEVLEALVPDPSERRYVLRWLAWKIQNPGGVPDTILIFKGAKGAGKNSVFDPVVLMFGLHGMAVDEPELIAGRFTGHLMTLSFAMLDEAVFVGDPKQADRIKSRVTAKTMTYEHKGMTPVQGVNRCAYVMLTNHEYVWQATSDERRAVVIEAGESLRGNLEFWKRYHAWAIGDGPAALLHYLQGVDLTGFNPREIPKGEALRKQVEQTALRNPAAAWWYQCLTEGEIRWRDGSIERVVQLDETADTEINRAALRLSYEQSAAARGRASTDWAAVARRLSSWAGPAGLRKTRVRTGPRREWHDVLPPLPTLRASFTAATQVEVAE